MKKLLNFLREFWYGADPDPDLAYNHPHVVLPVERYSYNRRDEYQRCDRRRGDRRTLHVEHIDITDVTHHE